MKKIILIIFLFLLNFLPTFSSYKVDLPNSTNNNVNIGDSSISKGNTYYKDLSKTINKYLWYSMGVISFAMLIYAGILLVSSNGSSEDLKKANRILIWGLVGIFVSLFSYIIINLLINLF